MKRALAILLGLGLLAAAPAAAQVPVVAEGPIRISLTGRIQPQFNTSTAKSKGGDQSRAVDRLTGIILPPVKESAFYHNVSLWYDDGRINARVAYQTRDIYFQELRVEGTNRVPGLTAPGINGLGDEITSGNGTTSYFKVANPAFRSKTNSLDARASFNVTDKIQIFVEGKNLLDDTQYKHTPNEYREISPETTYRWDNTFVGRKYYVGLIYTFDDFVGRRNSLYRHSFDVAAIGR